MKTSALQHELIAAHTLSDWDIKNTEFPYRTAQCRITGPATQYLLRLVTLGLMVVLPKMSSNFPTVSFQRSWK